MIRKEHGRVYEQISPISTLSYSKLSVSLWFLLTFWLSAPFSLLPSSFPSHCWDTSPLSPYLVTHKMSFPWQTLLFSREEAISSSFSPPTVVFLLKGYNTRTANKAMQSASARGTEKWSTFFLLRKTEKFIRLELGSANEFFSSTMVEKPDLWPELSKTYTGTKRFHYCCCCCWRCCRWYKEICTKDSFFCRTCLYYWI